MCRYCFIIRYIVGFFLCQPNNSILSFYLVCAYRQALFCLFYPQLSPLCMPPTIPIRYTTLLLLVFLGCYPLLVKQADAQVPPVGRALYERLARTRSEYQAAMASGDSLQVAETCYLMGKRYGAIGDYVTAQKWFTRSLRIREPRGPSEDIGKVYLRIAEHQFIQKDYEAAAQAAKRAEANMQYARSQKGLMSSGILMASVYQKIAKSVSPVSPARLDSALYFLRRSEKLALALKNPVDIRLIYSMMADYLEDTDPQQAARYLQKMRAIAGYDKQTLINLYTQLARHHLRSKQSREAKKWLDKATVLRDSNRLGDYIQNRNIEQAYTNVYLQRGQWRQAFGHQKKYYTLLVQLLNADRDGAITRIEKQYESYKQETRLIAQHKELKLHQQNLATQQKLTLMTLLLCVVACIACAVLFWLLKKYQRLSVHNAQLVKEQNHRVKNNLQSITSLLDLQSSRLTDLAARRAVEESLLRVEAMALLHQRLYDGDRLAEVDLAQYIPELVSMVLRGFGFDRLQPRYHLHPVWLDADAAINIGLLLNELVTNACKYAFPQHQQPTLEIGCQEENGQISLWLADNGPGFRSAGSTNSFGMTLVDMVAQKLKGKYQFDTSRGCLFSLTFNVKLSSSTY